MGRDDLIYQLCRLLEARARQQRESMRLAVPGLGPTCVPYEFWSSVSCSRVEVMETSVCPSAVEGRIRSGAVVVLRGDFSRAVGILKYLDRKGTELIERTGFQAMPNRFERSRQEQAEVRNALHRVTVLVRHGRLTNLKGGPFRQRGSRTDLSRWIEGAADYPEETTLLVPLRKILRIASDVRRFEQGVFVRALNAHLLVFPAVFAPVDQKVVSLLAQHLAVKPGEEALDVGTGTGVLAFIAARRGACVVATDCNAEAVRNARLNARRLGLENAVEVLGPSRMFDGLGDRKFDAVLFNAPWLKGNPRTTYEAAIYDDGLVIEAFLGGVSPHLKPEGRIWLIYADVFQRTGQEALARVAALLEGNGLEIRHQWGALRTGRVSGRGEKVVVYMIARKNAK